MTAMIYDHNCYLSRTTYSHFRMGKNDIQQKTVIESSASSGSTGKKVSLWPAELNNLTEA